MLQLLILFQNCMILRSQIKSQGVNQNRNEPLSIRDLMKEYDVTTNNNITNQPSNGLFPVAPRTQQLSILKTIAEMPMPPPSHIQSETSIDVQDVRHHFPAQNKTPRRRKIFEQNKSKVMSFNQNHRIINNGNLQSVINTKSENPKKNPLFPTPTFSKSRPFEQNPDSKISNSINDQNSVYNTVGSMKKRDIINFSNCQQQKKISQEQSGISLKIRQPSAEQSPQSSLLKERVKSKIEQSIPNMNQNSNTSNSHLHNSTLKSLIKHTIQNGAPVPVYQSQFHRGTLNMFRNADYNSIPEKLVQQFQFPADNQQKAKNRANQPFHTGNISFNNIPIQNEPQFENRNSNSISFPIQNFRNNSFSPQNLPYEKQSTFEKMGNVSTPVYTQIYQKNITTQNQNIPSILSPFDETQKEEFKEMPKRFSLLQNKIQQQQQEIKKISQRLYQTQTKQLQAQKQLLSQLIKKQEQLNQKQKQINQNLEQIERLQTEQSLRKEQILKYQLELQQARRLEDLHKQNERLYHELIRRDRQAPIIKSYQIVENKKKQNSISFNQIKDSQKKDMFKGFLSPFTIKHELA